MRIEIELSEGYADILENGYVVAGIESMDGYDEFDTLVVEIRDKLRAHDKLVKDRAVLVAACEGLYDTVQDIRHVINGALMGESAEIPDDVLARCQAHIRQYRAALAAIQEENDERTD